MTTFASDSLSQTTYKLTPITAVLGVQMLCVAFGALVLVPLLTGLDPNVEPRNLTIVALVLVSGVGGPNVGTAEWALKGIGLAGIMGVAANLVLPGRPRQS